jgi:hypothetical protein
VQATSLPAPYGRALAWAAAACSCTAPGCPPQILKSGCSTMVHRVDLKICAAPRGWTGARAPAAATLRARPHRSACLSLRSLVASLWSIGLISKFALPPGVPVAYPVGWHPPATNSCLGASYIAEEHVSVMGHGLLLGCGKCGKGGKLPPLSPSYPFRTFRTFRSAIN